MRLNATFANFLFIRIIRPQIWIAILGLSFAIALTGCASEVVRYGAVLKPQTKVVGASVIVIAEDTLIALETGYSRTLPRGSKWAWIGTIPEGDVYKPLEIVFTVEGAHVHEAYIVVNQGTLVGFYLPVEKAFSPLSSKYLLKLTQ